MVGRSEVRIPSVVVGSNNDKYKGSSVCKCPPEISVSVGWVGWVVVDICLGISTIHRTMWDRVTTELHLAPILHGLDPLNYFSFQPVLHDWCNKGRGMCYPVCWIVHIKEPLLLIGKSSQCGGSGFPLSLSEWSLTICLTPYNRK